MIQLEKIRIEIERRIEQFKEERNKIPPTPKSVYRFCRISFSAKIAALEGMLDYINSLSAEQPSEDLEESIIEFLGHVPENEPEHSETLYTYEQMQEIARHFAQWQKEQISKSVNVMDFNEWPGIPEQK